MVLAVVLAVMPCLDGATEIIDRHFWLSGPSFMGSSHALRFCVNYARLVLSSLGLSDRANAFYSVLRRCVCPWET